MKRGFQAAFGLWGAESVFRLLSFGITLYRSDITAKRRKYFQAAFSNRQPEKQTAHQSWLNIVSTHHRSTRQHMTLHRKVQIVETETLRQVQLGIERIHNQLVAVAAVGRRHAAVA